MESELEKMARHQGSLTAYIKPEAASGRYALFSEQYLEPPVISGDVNLAIAPSCSTFKGIWMVDDL